MSGAPRAALDALAALGKGFGWPLFTTGVDDALVARVRPRVARRAHERRASPLVPESACAVARRIHDERPGARVVGVDAEPALLDALAALGHDVAALAFTVDAAHYAEAGIPVTASSVGAPIPDALRGGGAVVVVDTFGHDRALVPLLSRALAVATQDARISVLVHALDRDRVRDAVALLPAATVARDDEVCARLLAGPALADVFWDRLVVAPRAGDLAIDADTTVADHALARDDPDLARHGCVEIHDLLTPVDARDLDRALDAFVAARGGGAALRTAHDAADTLHRLLVLDDETTVAFILSQGRGALRVDVHPWSPSLHVDLGASIIAALPRRDGRVSFGRSAR